MKKKTRKPKANPYLVELRSEPRKSRVHVVAYRDAGLSDALIGQIVSYVGVGGHPEIAANACGVSTQTFREWLRRGSKAIEERSEDGQEQMYAVLVQRVLSACAKAELRHLTSIYDASKRDWKASQYVLSTRFKERWDAGERLSKVIVEGNPLAPIEHVHTAGYVPVDVSTLTLAECQALMRSIQGEPERPEASSEIIDVPALESRILPPTTPPESPNAQA